MNHKNTFWKSIFSNFLGPPIGIVDKHLRLEYLRLSIAERIYPRTRHCLNAAGIETDVVAARVNYRRQFQWPGPATEQGLESVK